MFYNFASKCVSAGVVKAANDSFVCSKKRRGRGKRKEKKKEKRGEGGEEREWEGENNTDIILFDKKDPFR